MEVNLYLESTIKSPRESEGIIGFVIEVQTKGEPATRFRGTKEKSIVIKSG